MKIGVVNRETAQEIHREPKTHDYLHEGPIPHEAFYNVDLH
jgi:hypothetical protein